MRRQSKVSTTGVPPPKSDGALDYVAKGRRGDRGIAVLNVERDSVPVAIPGAVAVPGAVAGGRWRGRRGRRIWCAHPERCGEV